MSRRPPAPPASRRRSAPPGPLPPGTRIVRPRAVDQPGPRAESRSREDRRKGPEGRAREDGRQGAREAGCQAPASRAGEEGATKAPAKE